MDGVNPYPSLRGWKESFYQLWHEFSLQKNDELPTDIDRWVLAVPGDISCQWTILSYIIL